MLVSIIIPTFNRADLIEETLISIANQSFKNFECLIIDDHSVDSSEEIIKKFISKDQRFRYYKRPKCLKKGPSSCRNYGFSKSKGDLITWFDDDDIMLVDSLLHRVKAFISNTDCVVCPLLAWDFKKDKAIYKTIIKSNNLIGDYLDGKVIFFVSGPLWKRSFLEGQTVLFDENISNLDDWDFNLRMLYAKPKIHFVEMPLILYRIHYSSLTFRSDVGFSQKIKSEYRARFKHLALLEPINNKLCKWYKENFQKRLNYQLLQVLTVDKKDRLLLLKLSLELNLYLKDFKKCLRQLCGFCSYILFNKGYLFFSNFKDR